jgi:hypothetical protein
MRSVAEDILRKGFEMIDFGKLRLGREEARRVGAIVKRAKAANLDRGRQDSDLTMDLVAARANCPLNFERLLGSSDADFAHDIAGIIKFMDRETGELRECFLPRAARGAVACSE